MAQAKKLGRPFGANGKKKKPSHKDKSGRTRVDWQANHAIIFGAFMDLIKEKSDAGKPMRPTNREIGRRTGFTHQTINDHIAEIDFAKVCDSARIFTPQIITSLAIRATKNVADAKLFLQVIEEYNEKNIHEFKGKVVQETEDDLSKYTTAELKQIRNIHAAAKARKED